MHRNSDDLVGRLRGDLLNVHAALAAGHHHHALLGSIKYSAKVNLRLDVGSLINQHLLDRQTLDIHPEDGVGGGLCFFGRSGKFDASRLAAPANEYLALDDYRLTQFIRYCACISGGLGYLSLWNPNTMFCEDTFRLVLM